MKIYNWREKEREREMGGWTDRQPDRQRQQAMYCSLLLDVCMVEMLSLTEWPTCPR